MKPREIERSREKSRVDAMYDPESQLGDPKRRPKDLKSQLGNHRKPREIESDDFQNSIVIEILCLGAWIPALLGSLGEIDF